MQTKKQKNGNPGRCFVCCLGVVCVCVCVGRRGKVSVCMYVCVCFNRIYMPCRFVGACDLLALGLAGLGLVVLVVLVVYDEFFLLLGVGWPTSSHKWQLVHTTPSERLGTTLYCALYIALSFSATVNLYVYISRAHIY